MKKKLIYVNNNWFFMSLTENMTSFSWGYVKEEFFTEYSCLLANNMIFCEFTKRILTFLKWRFFLLLKIYLSNKLLFFMGNSVKNKIYFKEFLNFKNNSWNEQKKIVSHENRHWISKAFISIRIPLITLKKIKLFSSFSICVTSK